jgi:hypothetical protein
MRRLVPLATLALLAACAQETLLQTNFDATPFNTPPAHAQQVGTANVSGPPGSVVVAPAPAGSSGTWVSIGRPNKQSDIASFQGVLSQTRPPGHYTFSTVLYMPAGPTDATIQFEPVPTGENPLLSFLHLDFTTDNKVRINDDDSTKFGSFTRNTPFDLFVGLDTNLSPPVAHISLIGAGASGSVDYPIQGGYQTLAVQFNAVRLWMGVPYTGTFLATGITVTHNTQ